MVVVRLGHYAVRASEHKESGERRHERPFRIHSCTHDSQELPIIQVVPGVLSFQGAHAVPERGDCSGVEIADAGCVDGHPVRGAGHRVRDHRVDLVGGASVIPFPISSEGVACIAVDEQGTVFAVRAWYPDDDEFLPIDIGDNHVRIREQVRADLLCVVQSVPESVQCALYVRNTFDDHPLLVIFHHPENYRPSVGVGECGIRLPETFREAPLCALYFQFHIFFYNVFEVGRFRGGHNNRLFCYFIIISSLFQVE